MAQQTFSGVPGDFTAGQVLTAADMDLLREFLLYLIKDGDETDTGEVSPLILDLNDNRVGVNTDAPAHELDVQATGDTVIRVKSNATGVDADDDATLIIDCADTGESVISFQQDGVEKADIHWFSAGEPDLNIRTASGTDGVIDFQPNGTLALRVAADGNVGIGGVTAPGSLLHVEGAGGTFPMIQLHSTNSDRAYLNITNSTTGAGYDNGLLLGVASTEEVLIHNRENTHIAFATNDTERMRLGSSGRLYVNTTNNPSTDAWLNVKTADGTKPCLNMYQVSSTAGHNLLTIYSDVGGSETQVVIVEADGGFQSAADSYGPITSDQRLKTVEACRDYFDDLMELEVVNFQFTKRFVPTIVPTLDDEGNPVLDDDGEAVMEEHPTEGEFVDRDPADYSPKQLGLVAQQVEPHIPGLVKTNDYGVKTLKTSVLIPMLLQAVQTLSARIEALEA